MHSTCRIHDHTSVAMTLFWALGFPCSFLAGNLHCDVHADTTSTMLEKDGEEECKTAAANQCRVAELRSGTRAGLKSLTHESRIESYESRVT